MKIIHVLRHPMTGVWSSLLNLAKEQHTSGKSVFIYLTVKSSWPSEYLAELKNSGIKFQLSYYPDFKVSYLLLFFKGGLYNYLKKITNNFTCDKIVLHFHNSEFSAVFLRKWMKGYNFKIVTTFHGMPGINEKFKNRRWLQRLLFKLLMHFESNNVCVDREGIYDAERVLGYEKNLFTYIPNGIKSVVLPSKLALAERKESIICSFVGSIDDNKGWELVVDAIDYLHSNGNNISLLVAGDGYKRECLLNKISDKKYITYLGKTSEIFEDVYKHTDMNIMASKNEGMPMVLLECFNYEVPVISTLVGAVEELKALNFCITEIKRDYVSIANAILENISSTNELTTQNKRLLKEYFDISSISAKYEEIYHA